MYKSHLMEAILIDTTSMRSKYTCVVSAVLEGATRSRAYRLASFVVVTLPRRANMATATDITTALLAPLETQ